VLQCVAVCCSVLQCVAVCCSELQCVAVWICLAYLLLQCMDAHRESIRSTRIESLYAESILQYEHTSDSPHIFFLNAYRLSIRSLQILFTLQRRVVCLHRVYRTFECIDSTQTFLNAHRESIRV